MDVQMRKSPAGNGRDGISDSANFTILMDTIPSRENVILYKYTYDDGVRDHQNLINESSVL